MAVTKVGKARNQPAHRKCGGRIHAHYTACRLFSVAARGISNMVKRSADLARERFGVRGGDHAVAFLAKQLLAKRIL